MPPGRALPFSIDANPPYALSFLTAAQRSGYGRYVGAPSADEIEILTDRWNEIDRIVEIETDILYETGAVINALPFRAGAYQERTPLVHELRREGIDL